jgi:hypothetical protein
MAYTTIDNPVEYFSATLYTANGTARTIATGHQSDWVWLKRRDGAAGHRIADSVRGVNKLLYADSSTNEQSASNTITGFVSTGFTLGDDSGGYDVNTSSNTMVAWSWKAGTSFTNDASSTGVGTIDSTGSVSDTAGFSITSYTGTGSAGTIKHGLSTVPKMIIVKNRDAAQHWGVYHVGIGNTKHLRLNSTNAASDSNNLWNNTTPTSSVFSVAGQDMVNKSGDNSIAYCFAEKKGYSKFGSYTGNGNADGTFVYTGFKPAFVIAKNTGASEGWSLFDNKRSTSGANLIDDFLVPSSSEAEISQNVCDFVSNGIKFRHVDGKYHNSGGSYIYMAFAESPFVNSNGVPNNAR